MNGYETEIHNGQSNGQNGSGATEQLLIITRQHWFVLATKIAGVIVLSILYLLGSSFFLLVLTFSPMLFTASLLVFFALAISVVAKLVVDWYFHVYTVTTRKILEICCTPLSSYAMNEVLLDQVRCTEVDVRMGGLLNELLDKGDIYITFDRHTHEEAFMLCDIPHPEEKGMFLGNMLITATQETQQIIWDRRKVNGKPIVFNFPEEQLWKPIHQQ